MISYQQKTQAEQERTAWGLALLLCGFADGLAITHVQSHGVGHAFVALLSAVFLWSLYHVRRTGKVLRAWDLQESAEEAERQARRDL